MKKTFYLTLFLFAISLATYSQSQRLVLVEEATNASCGPCASQNPAFDALLQANPDKLVALKYHWYFPGYDPMHNHNPEENNSRVSYYGINGVPHALIDGSSITGSSYVGAPANCTQAKIDNAYAIPSPFEITMYHEVNNGVINVAMLIEATENVNGNLRARMAVVEKHIHFNSAPGSNGETDFYDVMKKMLPNPSGIALKDNIEAGEYFLIQQSWELANIYNMDELGVVGFIQDNTSKAVHQAGDSNTDPIIPLYSNDAEITDVSNISVSNCLGYINPVIVIRNNGSDVFTSANITYTMNSGDMVTFEWTGNLAFLESETVTLPESNFTLMDMNILHIEIENPNGQTDDYPLNNVQVIEIPRAIEAQPTITLILKLDDNPEETTWEFVSSFGDIIYEGGPYSTPGQQIIEQYEFESTDCYTFNIYDAGGNGLTGSGTFAVGFGSTIIIQGNEFGSKAEGQFNVSFTNDNETISENQFQLYPNPVNDFATLSFSLFNNQNVRYSVTNLLGETVLENNLGRLSPGMKTIPVNFSGLNEGVYFLKLEINNQEIIKKIILSN